MVCGSKIVALLCRKFEPAEVRNLKDGQTRTGKRCIQWYLANIKYVAGKTMPHT